MLASLYIELNNISAIVLRLVIAFIAGGFIGWERETYTDLPISHRGSIFRMYALVCFGSCMFTVAGIFGFSAHDPDRIAAQVVTGVGFLGAGIILKDKVGIIRGLPTAAGMWVSASIGLMIGAGHYITGCVGTFLAFLIMDIPHRFPKLFSSINSKDDPDLELPVENNK